MRLLPPNDCLGYVPYLWLLYLAFFVMTPAFGRASPTTWLATLLGVSLFLPLYFRAFWLKGRQVLWPISGMVMLGSVYAPFNSGASAMFIFAAAFLGQVGPVRTGVKYLVVLLAYIGSLSWVLGLPPHFWAAAASISAVVGLANIHFAQRRREEWKLRLAHEEIEHLAAVAERERIARDLHDLLGHTLSLIVLKSELAARLAQKDIGRAVAEIGDVERVSRQVLAQVREAVRGYRTSGIAGEARKAYQELERAGLTVDCHVEELVLPAAHETVLALALREAVTNIIRHARASSCTIQVRRVENRVEMEIADNGCGGEAREGSGLAGMRERVRSLGGTLSRDGSQGTSLLIQLPGEATRAASGVA